MHVLTLILMNLAQHLPLVVSLVGCELYCICAVGTWHTVGAQCLLNEHVMYFVGAQLLGMALSYNFCHPRGESWAED